MADNTGNPGLEENVAGLLCYIPFWIGFIVSIIFLIIDKRKFVRFHAVQSLLFSVVAVIFSVISWILVFIPVLGALIIAVVVIGIFVVWIMLMVKAYQHQMYKLPFIGDLADKYSNT